MECIEQNTNLDNINMNAFVKLLKKTGLLSVDFIYRLYFMSIFGSRLYYRNRISPFRSCVFCKNLMYVKVAQKYICLKNEHPAGESLVPCILPNASSPADVPNKSYLEDIDEVPWLFKNTCQQFNDLESNNYFKNFLSFDINSSIIKLETLEAIMFGTYSDQIPCHICAYAAKELYTCCDNVNAAKELGRCTKIFDTLQNKYDTDERLSNIRSETKVS